MHFFFSSFFLFLFFSVASRCGRGPFNNHFGPGRGDRLLQAIYESGNLHHDKKAPEVQARGVLLPGSFGLWDLDVHRLRLHWRERRPLPGQPLQPLRVAQWRVWGRAGPDHQRPVQWVWNIQQLVVLPGSLHAAGMWHFSQVSLLFSTLCSMLWVFCLFVCLFLEKINKYWEVKGDGNFFQPSLDSAFQLHFPVNCPVHAVDYLDTSCV